MSIIHVIVRSVGVIFTCVFLESRFDLPIAFARSRARWTCIICTYPSNSTTIKSIYWYVTNTRSVSHFQEPATSTILAHSIFSHHTRLNCQQRVPLRELLEDFQKNSQRWHIWPILNWWVRTFLGCNICTLWVGSQSSIRPVVSAYCKHYWDELEPTGKYLLQVYRFSWIGCAADFEFVSFIVAVCISYTAWICADLMHSCKFFLSVIICCSMRTSFIEPSKNQKFICSK